MSARLIDGVKIACNLTEQLAKVIAEKKGVRKPCLAVLLVGNRPDSQVYVRMKQTAAEKIGIHFRLLSIDTTATQSELEELVLRLNADGIVDGIIVQMPLPAHLDAFKVTQLVAPEKDVDGFHTSNLGHLFRSATKLGPVHPRASCTARGVVVLIESTGTTLEGKTVVLIGTGNVGKPLSLMLMQRGASVICCNKFTHDIDTLARLGDVLVAAAGCPNLVRGSWIKPGAVVIDVGINSVPDASRKSGYRLVGDVNFEEARSVASHITPVPGGVGPMTVAMLLTAVVETWRLR